MIEVQRIWRVGGSTQQPIQLRLVTTDRGERSVLLEDPRDGQGNGQLFDVTVARVLAQVMLEACEVASALDQQADEVL